MNELAQQLRVDAIRAATGGPNEQPMAAISAAELLAVLIARHLRVDPEAPDDPGRDHLVFSRGDAAPLLAAALHAAGTIDENELLASHGSVGHLRHYRRPGLPLVPAAIGSLGIGLSIGTGLAMAMQRLEPRSSRIWILCSEAELSEGSVWEAVEAAGVERLDALTMIVDIPRVPRAAPSQDGWDLHVLRRRFEAFDWRVVEIDGHDVRAIDAAYRTAAETRFRPTLILARTIQGLGVRGTMDRLGLHGQPSADAEGAILELGGVRHERVSPPRPIGARPRDRRSPGRGARRLPTWAIGESVAVQDAVGAALVALGTARPDLVVLDSDGRESIPLARFRDVDTQRFFQAFSAERLLVGAAVGFAIRGWTSVAGSFAAALARAADIVRVAAEDGIPVRLVGSEAGLLARPAAASHLGLDDVGVFRAIHGAAVLQPSDANQAAQLLAAMLEWPGVSYLRVIPGVTTVRTPARARATIGGSREVVASDDDRIAIIASGATVGEAVRASALLAGDGLPVRVIDAYSVKPLDTEAVAKATEAVGGRVVVVEDHRPEGGLGSAVAEAMAERGVALRMVHLAVREVAALPEATDLGNATGIDAYAIRAAAMSLAEAS